MSKSYTFDSGEVYVNDPDNPNKKILKIPDKIMKEQGWTQGTVLKIKIGDQGTIIIEESEKEVDKSE